MAKTTKKTAPAKKKVANAPKVKKAVVAKPVDTPAADGSVADIAKSLREFRFGAAGSKAKNTSLPKSMRKQRARLLTLARQG
jgi:hypothetical protein